MDAMRLELDYVRVEQLVGAGVAALGRPRLREILLGAQKVGVRNNCACVSTESEW